MYLYIYSLLPTVPARLLLDDPCQGLAEFQKQTEECRRSLQMKLLGSAFTPSWDLTCLGGAVAGFFGWGFHGI